MSDFVWHVETEGGTPDTVKAAIERGVEKLKAGDVPRLDADELEPWQQDISFVAIEAIATEAGGVSALVDIDTFGDRTWGAVLSGGFDEAILDEVINVEGVTTATHSDKIERPRGNPA